MLLGYVSDERYFAIAVVDVEIIGKAARMATRSVASGVMSDDVAGQLKVNKRFR
jgi:hypothetical protein